MPTINTQLYGEMTIIPWPFETGSSEKLEWFTDRFESYNGTEDRLANVSVPAQSFELVFPVNYPLTQEFFNTSYAKLRNNLWAIPLYNEAQKTNAIPQGSTILSGSFANFDFRDSSLSLLYENENWEIVEIVSSSNNELNIDGGTVNNYTNPFIMPVRKGFVVEDVNYRNFGISSSYKINFKIDDVQEISPAVPMQYKNEDVLLEPFLIGEAVNRTISKDQDIIDFKLGPVERRSRLLNTRLSTRYSFLAKGQTEIKSFKDFLYRRQGKFRSFWYPTFEQNFKRVSSGIIVNSFNANSYSYDPTRNNIAILKKDGSWHLSEIEYSEIDSQTVQITMDSALNTNSDEIVLICYLGLNRLDTDLITMNFEGNSVISGNIQILEIGP